MFIVRAHVQSEPEVQTDLTEWLCQQGGMVNGAKVVQCVGPNGARSRDLIASKASLC